MRIAQEEIFGPTTALIPVRSFDEAVAAANSVRVRPLVLDLHARRQPRVPRDARPADGDHVHQRGHDRRRGAPAVRRHEADRQRPPRGRPGGARRLHRVEVDLRRLLGPAAAGADRQRQSTRERGSSSSSSRRRRSSRARRGVRGRRRPDRRLRALLLVHGGHRDVPRAARAPTRRSARSGGRSGSPSCGSRRCSRTSAQADVIAALRAAHPYEEPAFDVYRAAA